MVTRKPVPSLNTSNAGRKADPPYPMSPQDTTKTPATASSVYSSDRIASPAFDLIDVDEAQSRQRRNSDASSHGTWDTGDEEEEEAQEEDGFVEVSKPSQVTPSKQNLAEQSNAKEHEEIPAILRPGPAVKPSQPQQFASEALANPWAAELPLEPKPLTSDTQSINPYLRSRAPSSASASSPPSTIPAHPPPLPPQPSQPAPVELPTVRTPAEELSKLSLGSNPPLPPKSVETTPNHTEQVNTSNTGKTSLPEGSPAPHQKLEHQPTTPLPPVGPPPSMQQNMPSSSTLRHESLLDQQGPVETQPHGQQHQTAAAAGSIQKQTAQRPEHAQTAGTNQRVEHYQIKHINWQDDSTRNTHSAIRQSPILTQNANGPCPLLALVNALVLTTPETTNTALIETLNTREQISLGLLLDAVFDELMSGRRGDSATMLPDVSELYAFLLALHTGMNVNPRFVSDERLALAGDFERTREMKLYATFNVPLIHGWLPQMDSQAEKAFKRRAQSFEDAQNIQFAEVELEDKLRASGLTSDEQLLLQDIQTIKHFLNTWPTQLTDRGLEDISRSLQPGQFAILFRNDHFSTIYKEPKHGALMTLVTDAGYSSHDEIVWESLVDVNGAASELFSGDFRVVSHTQDARLNQQSSAGGEEGWTTVPSRSNQASNQHEHVTTASRPPPPPPATDVAPALPGPRPPTLANTIGQPDDIASGRQRSRSEQEDHDLALALQLQEEEEAQQRQTEDRRRREQQLSEQFLSTDVDARPPTIPPRRGGSRQSTSTRPGVNRPAGQAFNPDAPPTYEQSASDRPYREAGSTARPAQSSPLTAYEQLRRQQEQNQSAYAQQSGNSVNANTAQYHGRRQSYGRGGRRPQHAATAQDAEERCMMM